MWSVHAQILSHNCFLDHSGGGNDSMALALLTLVLLEVLPFTSLEAPITKGFFSECLTQFYTLQGQLQVKISLLSSYSSQNNSSFCPLCLSFYSI